VVSPQQSDVIWILHLETQQKLDGLDTIMTTIDKVALIHANGNEKHKVNLSAGKYYNDTDSEG
jgi:hypothetical protein